MAQPLNTWYRITRACKHVETVRAAGPYDVRRKTIDELRTQACSPCAGWPVLAVDEAVSIDLTAPGSYPEPRR